MLIAMSNYIERLFGAQTSLTGGAFLFFWGEKHFRIQSHIKRINYLPKRVKDVINFRLGEDGYERARWKFKNLALNDARGVVALTSFSFNDEKSFPII
jgi:hypothetical protein